ncbi:MAG: hypothetical protein AAF333_07340 [Planctomycetota bacterium]
MVKSLLLIHAAATLYMVGLIWFVQVVHYPLFDGVGEDGFAAYEDRHARRTTWVVLPPMVIELVTAVWLVAQRSTLLPGVPAWQAWAGLGLVVFLWAVTFLVSVPQHQRLTQGFDVTSHRILTDTNWLRTTAWSLRGGLVLWMVALRTRG